MKLIDAENRSLVARGQGWGGGCISEPTDKDPGPHDAFILVQKHMLRSIVKYVLDRDVC